MGVAATLEGVAAQAKAGTMTKEKAIEAVNAILSLAGVPLLTPAPLLKDVADTIIDRAKTDSTRKKYLQAWKLIEAFGAKQKLATLTDWTPRACEQFYVSLTDEYAASTANQHFDILNMIFARAIRTGAAMTNPTGDIQRARETHVEKAVISRKDQAAILRTMRREKRRDWALFACLGWHTGHRMQDLLDTTTSNIEGDLITITPRKKANRKNSRTIVLPLPQWLAASIQRLGSFQSLGNASNASGIVSTQFGQWIVKAGIDPKPVKRKKATINQVSHHSYRHGLTSRLAAAGVPDSIARMVTDHDSAAVHRRYQHAEVEALREALRKAR